VAEPKAHPSGAGDGTSPFPGFPRPASAVRFQFSFVKPAQEAIVGTPETSEPSREEKSSEPLRSRSRAGRYARVFVLVALVVVLIALVVANTPRTVELSWGFGSGEVSIVWIIVVSAILGWLVGIVTGALVRHSTRGRT
jgi:uncharacterized integral membrane protein